MPFIRVLPLVRVSDLGARDPQQNYHSKYGQTNRPKPVLTPAT